jgi:hypothetical protein
LIKSDETIFNEKIFSLTELIMKGNSNFHYKQSGSSYGTSGGNQKDYYYNSQSGSISNKVSSNNYEQPRKKAYAKNYSGSRRDKIDYLDDYLVEDHDYVDTYSLKSYCKNDPQGNIKVVENVCPIDSNLMMVDISMNPKGVDEELVYLQFPEYIKNIRRGNTLIEVYYYDKRKEDYELEEVIMARKGMMKFVDLPKEILEIKDDKYLRIDHLEESKKNARWNIMGPVFRAFEKQKSVEVFKLIKANGENAQISFLKNSNMWAIASKNVCLLAKNRQDLEFYAPKRGEISRYSFAYVIGHCWFDFLEKLLYSKNENLISDLKNYLSNKTFIGEYVGNQNYQHLIRYLKHTILFYAIVDNNSEENSLTVPQAYEVFRKFKLDVVPYEHIGVFDDHKSLCQALDKLYVRIAESSIIYEEEGSVIYLSEVNKSNRKEDRILVLCKLKTLEYRVYRKLREKLKNHLLQAEGESADVSALQSRRKINQFFEEVRIMLQGFTLPMPMSFYYKVAETAFSFANKFYENCKNLNSSYIDFIEVIHSIIDTTVDLKSRTIKADNIMTYDTLLKNEIKSKKVVEIIIYAPPLYLPESFLKALEKKFSTEIRNSFVNDYASLDTNILIYHINMHNFRVFNKLEENKFIFAFGLNESGCKMSIENLSEKMQNPQLISYNTNASLTPFLKLDSEERNKIMNGYMENSKIFLERTKQYVGDKLKIYDNFSAVPEEGIINDMENIVKEISSKIENLNTEKIIKESFIFNESSQEVKSKLDNSNKITSVKSFNQYISLYENHVNKFTSLKEKFLKEENNLISLDCTKHVEIDNVKNSNTNSIKPLKKIIVVLVPMTIPGTGKTFFVEGLKEILSQSSSMKIAFDSISSDNIRREIIDDIKRRKRVDDERAFSMSGKSAAIQFETELRGKFRTLIENNDCSLLYLDKNHPPNAISRVFEPLREEMKSIRGIDKVDVKFVALLPDCLNTINLSPTKTISFSLAYFIQCYVRIKHRRNHPTLNGDKQDLICILAMFINNFVNFSLTEQNLMLHYQFNKAIKLPFTEEISEDQLPKDLLEAARDFLNNMPSGNNIPEYDSRAEKLERLINKYYTKPEKFKSTKNLVKETAEPVLRKLYISVDEIEEVVKEKVLKSNAEVEKIKVDNEILIKKSNESENIEISTESSKKKRLGDLFGNSSSSNSMKSHSVVEKPTKFLYLGLLVKNSKPTFYKDILITALSKFLTKDKNLTEAENLISQLSQDSLPKDWKSPHQSGDIWHVTTLFKGGKPLNSSITSHQVYKEFEEGKIVKLFVHGLVYVPNKTIFSIISADVAIDNEFPHITTLISGYAPKQSNDVMKALFNKGGEMEKEYKSILDRNLKGELIKTSRFRMDGFYKECYVYRFDSPVILNSEMHAFN